MNVFNFSVLYLWLGLLGFVIGANVLLPRLRTWQLKRREALIDRSRLVDGPILPRPHEPKTLPFRTPDLPAGTRASDRRRVKMLARPPY